MAAPCSIQAILDDNACLYAAPTYFLDVAIAVAWCGVNGNVGPSPPSGNVGWFNPEQPGLINNPESGTPLQNPES